MPTLTEHIVAMYYNTVPLNAADDPYVQKHACLLNLKNLLMHRKQADEEYARVSARKGTTMYETATKNLEIHTGAYHKEYERCMEILKMQ